MLKTTAIGFLGQDCILKQTTGGKTVVNFSIAHTVRYKDGKGNNCERTIWIECGAFEKEKIAPFLKKGTQVYVEGSVSPNAWVDKQTGEIKSSLRMNVFVIELLGKKESSNNAASAIEEEQAAIATTVAESEQPFVEEQQS